MKLGAHFRSAIACGITREGPWRSSKTSGIQQALSNDYLKFQGLVALRNGWIKLLRLDFDQVIKHILAEFSVDMSDIVGSQRGRREDNIPRWVVMHLGQALCGLRLRQIADRLGLKRTGSIPTTMGKLRRRLEEDKRLACQVEKIKSRYCI